MVRDLVVLVPGIMGSSLADEEGREVWGLSAGTILKALMRLGASLDELTLPPDLGDGPAPDGVVPTGLIGALHVIPGLWTPVQGYEALVEFLLKPRFGLTLDHPEAADASPGNLLLFAYDWRLSNRHTAELLKDRVERALVRWQDSHPSRRDAKAIFVCHSMGGLVARWYLDKLQGAEITRALITAGTPNRGALKALEQLVNGIRVGPGPLKADLTRFARSLPSSYQLLPEYACVEAPAGALQKTIELELPGLDSTLVRAGMEFHEQLDDCPPPAYPLHPVVGIDQPTWITARIDDRERVEPLNTIGEREPAGDGTVPRFSARPKAMGEHDPSLQGLAEGHGSLAVHRSVLDQVDFVLTAEDLIYREVAYEDGTKDLGLGISVPDLHDPGEPVEVVVRSFERRVLQVVAVDEHGLDAKSELVKFGEQVDETGRCIGAACIESLDPGGYLITTRAPDDPQGLEVSPVHATTLVWEA